MRRKSTHTANKSKTLLVARTLIAVCMAVLVSLAGCGPNQPSTLPESTNTANNSTGSSSPTHGSAGTPSPSSTEIPYTTDLSLSTAEKDAVQKALAALSEYTRLMNTVFTTKDPDITPLRKVTSDSVLSSIIRTEQKFRDSGLYTEGSITMSDYDVIESDFDKDDSTQIPFLKIEACTDLTQYRVLGGEVEVNEAARANPMLIRYVAAEYDGSWKISEQYDQADTCAK